MTTKTLTPALLDRIDAYWRAANYLSVGQIYLRDNPLLKRPLKSSDVKRMLLGHWGTTPGQNFIYKEEGTITTAFDLTVLNELDRFHLVMDAIDRLPRAGVQGCALKEMLQEKLLEHKRYIEENGQDLPEIRDWRWRS